MRFVSNFAVFLLLYSCKTSSDTSSSAKEIKGDPKLVAELENAMSQEVETAKLLFTCSSQGGSKTPDHKIDVFQTNPRNNYLFIVKYTHRSDKPIFRAGINRFNDYSKPEFDYRTLIKDGKLEVDLSGNFSELDNVVYDGALVAQRASKGIYKPSENFTIKSRKIEVPKGMITCFVEE